MKKITLCGSTKFKDEFLEYNKRLTLDGNVVLSVAFFGHADNINLTVEQKDLLDKIHLEKIAISDEIFVIDVGGYIGESTKNEIKHANFLQKKVVYLSNQRLKSASEHYPECRNNGRCTSICALCYDLL